MAKSIEPISRTTGEFNASGILKKREEVNSSRLDTPGIIGKAFTNLLRKAFDVTDCLVLLTQEMADHIYRLYMETEDMTNIELPYDELTKDILDGHVGEYVWLENFFEPVTDICSMDEFPRPFRMMFVDQMTEIGLLSMEEILYMIQDRMMDVYHAVRLMQSNNVRDSEIVQILSKAKLPEMDLTDLLYSAAARAKTAVCEDL